MAVVSWIDVPRYRNDRDRTTFQVILNGSGIVKYQFGPQLNLNGGRSNVGYESHDGRYGSSIIYHEAGRIQEGLAIAVIPSGGRAESWISLDPAGGLIEPHDEQEVEVIMDAGNMSEGDYAAELHILSNDISNDDYVVDITVRVGNMPNIEVVPELLDFGEVETGRQARLDFTIGNTGDEDLTVSSIYVEGDYYRVEFDGEFIVRPDEDHDIMVTFEPEGIGELEATVVILSDDPNEEEVYVGLLGVGLGEGWFIYDDGQQHGITENLRNYYSRTTFTSMGTFELRSVRIMPFNDGPNPNAPCYIYIFSEDEYNNLDDVVWATRINQLEPWDDRDFEANWIELRLPEERWTRFGQGEHFSIIYGMAPGGPYRQEQGYGWWNLFDAESRSGRSFVSTALVSDHRRWEEGQLNGDLFIRAGGEFLYTEPNNPPEWNYIYYPVIVEDGDRIQFTVAGSDPDEDDELEIRYYSHDLPNNVEFTDNGDGSGTFVWQTPYNISDRYTARFALTDGDMEVVTYRYIQVNDVNHPPVWVDPPEVVEVIEGDRLALFVVGMDPDRDRVRIRYSSDDLPRDVDFSDFGYGRAALYWKPGYDDEGEYSALFTISDGEHEVDAEVGIVVSESNRAPVWTSYPRDNRVVGYIDQEVAFSLIAEDPEGGDVELSWEYAGEPPGEPEVEVILDGGRAQFVMTPDRFEHGDYFVRFTASDGAVESIIDIGVQVYPYHFLYMNTGSAHTIRLDRVVYFGYDLMGEGNGGEGELEGEPSCDEIGVLTPDEVVAGVYRFNDPDQPGIMVAWGDIRYTDEVEGFQYRDEFTFLYWDHDLDVEYPVRYEIRAGATRWRWNGFTIMQLFIGPDLDADAYQHDFGQAFVGQEVSWDVTFTSTGSQTVENIELDFEGDGFRIDDYDPVDLEVGEELPVTVTFAPESVGEHTAILRALSGELEFLTIDLSGVGIHVDHFEFDVTGHRHQIEVLQANLDGEPLADGDEIGVYTPDDLCAGAAVVSGDGPYMLSAWGDDPETGPVDGFGAGEEFSFKFWDSDADREYTASAMFLSGPETWQENATSMVILQVSERHFDWIETEYTHHLQVDCVELREIGDREAEWLDEGDEIAVVTRRGLIAGGFHVEEHEGPYEFDAYGDDPETEYIVEGFLEGEPMYFRIWRGEDATEYLARAEWQNGDGTWTSGGEDRLTLHVAAGNRAPTWRPVGRVTGRENEELAFSIVAIDPNEDPVSLRLTETDLPPDISFVEIGDGSGQFTWTPDFEEAGQYSAQFEAYDGWDYSQLVVRIFIQNVNRPPTLAEIGDIEIMEGEPFSLILELAEEEPDGDRVAFSAENIPYGASMEENLFHWTPNNDQAGEYEEITFRVTDFGQPPLSDEETVTISVENSNNPPYWRPVLPITAREVMRVLFPLQAYDRDEREGQGEGDLELTSGNLPEGAQFRDLGGGIGSFTWQTDRRSAGVYHPYFVAFDGELRDTLVVDITITNSNRPPILEHIEDQTVMIGDTLDLPISATDSDPGDQEELVLAAGNLPESAQFEDLGAGEGRLYWIPSFGERGVYPEVIITATDPNGTSDREEFVLTASVVDNDPPLITDVYPDNEDTVQSNMPYIQARILDYLSEVETIQFSYDNEDYDDWEYDDETGEFRWWYDGRVAQGEHRFMIRAIDTYCNTAVLAVRYVVDSHAGEIDIDELPEYTRRSPIYIEGSCESLLFVQLWRDNDMIQEGRANPAGRFLFRDVPLNTMNTFTVTGYDLMSNVATPDWVSIMLDIFPPEIEMISPLEWSASTTPEIIVRVEDYGIGIEIEGGGFQRQGIVLFLDNERIFDWEYEDGYLHYQVEEALDEGEHIIAVVAVDKLGNMRDEPYWHIFGVDTEPPSTEHPFLGEEIYAISDRKPTLTIPVYDPLPTSGIESDSILLILDDEELDFDWYEVDKAVTYVFPEDDSLELGEHDLYFAVSDHAGNSFEASGEFIVADVDDGDAPFFDNFFPPPFGIAGWGGDEGGDAVMDGSDVTGDTVSFVIGDLDVGVDWETVRMQIIAINDPDDPGDNDTTEIYWEDMVARVPPGRVMAPMPRRQPGVELAPTEMPGLEEGINQVNVFGADEEGNDGEEEWEFFYDIHDPDPPEIDEPESEYVTEAEVTITGTTASDDPEYEEGYENNPILRVYVNGEMVVETDVDYDSEYTVEEVPLAEGENIIEATVVDAADNESDLSNQIEVYLDLTEPEIEDFEATDGPHLATGIPEFTATLIDLDSGIDPESIHFTIDELEVPAEFNEEENLMTAQVEEDNALENGEYTAQLIVFDLAGNSDTSHCDFDIDLDPVDPPQILTFASFTCISRVSLTGEGEVGTDVLVFLNDEEIGEISLTDSANFAFEYTAQNLPDTSYVDLMACNPAGTESEHTDAEMLVVDNDPPAFSDAHPGNGVTVDAETLEEVSVFVFDLISGVEPDSLSLRLCGEPSLFDVVETDSGYWLTVDVSGIEFEDDEAVEVSIEAYDRSIPPNTSQTAWEFVTSVSHPPVVTLPDTSFNEDEQLTLDLHDFVVDEDNSFDELELIEELLQGEVGNAELEYDEEEGFLHLSANENWFGDLQFGIQATDPDELSDADTAMVEVLGGNDPPVLGDIPADTTIFVDQEFTMRIEAEDIDQDDELTFGDNTDLFEISEVGGEISFTPSEEELGQHVIEIYVTDNGGAGDTAVFYLYVAMENEPVELIEPIDDVAVDEDSDPFVFAGLNEVFNDPEGADINYSVEYGDGIMIDIDRETNEAEIRLDPDFFGEVEVIVIADDLAGSQVADTFTVDVLPVNDPPRQVGLLPYEVVTRENLGRVVIAGLDTVFIDVDEGEIEYDWEGGEHLGVDINGDLELSITPDEGWMGEETFTLIVEDGIEPEGRNLRRIAFEGWRFNPNNDQGAHQPRRDEATQIEITVEVRRINHPPIAEVDDPYIVNMEEDQEPLVIEPPLDEMFSDSDPDEILEITWDILEGPIQLSLDEAEEHIIATIVEENFNGDFDYPIVCRDYEDEEVGLTLAFQVAAVNDPPEVVEQIDDFESEEDADPRRTDIIDLDNIFSDVDDEELSYGIVEAPEMLNIAVDEEDNMLYIEPEDNYNIPDGMEITVYADDGHGGERLAGFRTVRSVAPKTAAHDAGPVRQLRSIKPEEKANRDNEAVRQLRSISGWSQSAQNRQSVGSFFDVPRRDDTEEASFVLTITAVNDPPYWLEWEGPVIDEVQLCQLTVAADDIDLYFEGDELTASVIDDDGLFDRGAEFMPVGDNAFTLIWETGYDDAGTYHPVFEVEDLAGATDRMTAEIVIHNVNRAPLYDDIPDTVEVDEVEELVFTIAGSDPDGDDVTIEASEDDLPEGWEFDDHGYGTGGFTWTPTYYDSGVYTIQFTISDGEYDVDEDVVIIVNQVNCPPYWIDIPDEASAAEGEEIEFTVRGEDIDEDTLEIFTSDLGGRFNGDNLPEFEDHGDGTGTFHWYPDYDAAGEYTVTFYLSDGEYDVDHDVVITITNVNRSPAWDDIPDRVEGDEAEELSFTVIGSDPDEDDISLQAASEDLPEGWEFEDHGDGMGTFTWTPGYEDSGEYSLMLTLSDYQYDVQEDVVITVIHVNRPPVVVKPIDDVEIDEDSGTLEVADLDTVFEDPDGDELSFELVEGIEELNLNIDEETHLLTLEPALNYNGESEVVVAADDGQGDEDNELMSSMARRFEDDDSNATDEHPVYRFLRVISDPLSKPSPRRDLTAEVRFTVTILPVNDEPVWEEVPEDSLIYAIYDDVTFDFTASDVDEGDELTIELADRGGLPEAAGLEDRGDGVAVFTWMPTIDDMDEYNPIFSVSDGEAVVELERTLFIGNERNQVVHFVEGWNLVSINVSPGEEYYREGEDRGPDCRLMLEALRNDEDEQLFITMKDNWGDFCSNRWNYYGIRFWNLQEGYCIKTVNAWDAHWLGEPIAPDEPISIVEGWNSIPYYPMYQLPADYASDYYAFSSIIEHVERIKNGYGEFIAPEFGFSNMRPCAPGMGFHVNASQNVILEYPQPSNAAAVEVAEVTSADHWIPPASTGENMSVLITVFNGIEVANGDQVAAFMKSSGRLVGVGMVKEDVCGLAVWGDDSYSEMIDGISEGERFTLKLWDDDSKTEVELRPNRYYKGTGLVYAKDGFVALDVTTEAEVPEEYYLSQNYPNPFNPSTHIDFGLPVESDVVLSVWTTSGRLIDVIASGRLTAGRHTATWQADNLPTGIYFINLEAGGRRLVTKAVLIR